MTAGHDGDMWFTENGASKVGKINPSTGAITEYTIPTASAFPVGISPGPDGNVWFTENTGNKVGRITPSGVITEFAVPTANSGPQNITTGADGNIWFTEQNAGNVARLTVVLPAGTKPITGGGTGAGGTGFGGSETSSLLMPGIVLGAGLAAVILGSAGVTRTRRRRARP
jgi:streptogramin lyase